MNLKRENSVVLEKLTSDITTHVGSKQRGEETIYSANFNLKINSCQINIG